MKMAICFPTGREISGSIGVLRGKLGALYAPLGEVSGASFRLPSGGRIEVDVAEARLARGAYTSMCMVQCTAGSFSFHLRDVQTATPIYIPEYSMAVVPGADGRTYEEIADTVAACGLVSDFARFENEPEESYAAAARRNRRQYCQTWLGIGRDMRLFRVGYQEKFKYWGQVQPCYHTTPQNAGMGWEPGTTGASEGAYQVHFEIGQGASCRPRLTRRLEDGVLPILRARQIEQDVAYHLTVFATLENEPLTTGSVRGSDWRACYPNCGGHMTPPEERAELRGLLDDEMWGREQEVICCLRIEAVNTGRVPRYAWFRTATVRKFHLLGPYTADTGQFEGGFSSFVSTGKVFGAARLEGNPLPEQEVAVLLQPGERAVFDLLLPHAPLAPERARNLMTMDVEAHLAACRSYWRARIESAADIRVPERPVDESIRAGLLHCDLVALGREPDGPVLPTIGCYAPIGTESAPIIQFFDSMGWHTLAERCLDFFFARQRPDGFIQNFANYQSETGPLLWTAGEHYRYTRDTAWLQRVTPRLKQAIEYLRQWRRRNQTDAARAGGFYGMVDGKVADPNDFYHSFFLNAGTYLGLRRMADVLNETDPDYAHDLAREVVAYREDIRAGFYHAQARAPVVPLPDGSWAPMMPPWVEHTGAISLYADGGSWFSHGAFASRSCLTGPLWLIIGEVLGPHEEGADFLLKTNQYPVTLENAALSQPYYCRHDYAHIRRGETAAFLKTYYNQLTALQDRETHTFWEHYYHASEHKTHEEAWFLMQTRWMLWMEEGADLHLLRAIPRAWMAAGKILRLDRVKSYFGSLRLEVRSARDQRVISAKVCIEGEVLPERILLRLPHPERRRARDCAGGRYKPESETVVIDCFRGSAEVELCF